VDPEGALGPPDRNVAARRENADWFSSNVEWRTENRLPARWSTECAGTNGVTGRPTLRRGWHQTRSLARRGPGGAGATVILRERNPSAAARSTIRRQRRAASGRPMVGRFRNRIEGSPVARAVGHRGMRDGGNHPCLGGKRTGTIPFGLEDSVSPLNEGLCHSGGRDVSVLPSPQSSRKTRVAGFPHRSACIASGRTAACQGQRVLPGLFFGPQSHRAQPWLTATTQPATLATGLADYLFWIMDFGFQILNESESHY